MTHQKMADALGLSRPEVSKLVKRGMPIDSIEAAQAWRLRNSKEGIGHKSRSPAITAAARAMVERQPLPAATAEAEGDDPASAVARMHDAERKAYEMLSAALSTAERTRSPEDYAALPGLIRSHNAAAVNLLKATAAWEAHRRETGELAPTEHLRNVLTQTLDPLMARLQSLPALLAAEANPAAPAVAEAALAEAIHALRNRISATLAA